MRRIAVMMCLITCYGMVPADASDGLVGYYPFDGGGTDSSGNGNHGVVVGNPYYSPGACGQAIVLDGVDDYVDIGAIVSDLNAIGSGVGSIALWFRADADQTGSNLFNIWGGENLYAFLGNGTAYSSSESLTWLCRGVNYFAVENGHDFFFDGRWHHLAIVMGANYNETYLDGQKTSGRYFGGIGSPSVGGSLWPSAITTALIGRYVDDGSFFHKGAIDEVRIYDRALSAADVVNLVDNCGGCNSERDLPICYRPGQANTVTIVATPASDTQSWAVEEGPPANWSVSSISHGGQWDAANRKVKWGPFFDSQDRNLSYSVTPPSNQDGPVSFSGTMSVDGSSCTIGGETRISGPCEDETHPADTNDNWRLQINELTAYGAAWKDGDTWPRDPNPIPIDYVTNAGLLWKLGETYHYDAGGDPPWVTGGGKAFVLGGSAVSSFNPSSYTPGQDVTVSIVVTPDGTTNVYAVEDGPPAGWTISEVSDGGQFDGANRKVKWGPFFDSTSRTLSYTATPPAGTTGTKTFSGVVSFDGASSAITGARSIGSGGGPSADHIYWLDSAAHLAGLYGSQWRTDVVARNTGGSSASVEIVLHSDNGLKRFSNTVGPGDQGAFVDVVGLMGFEGKGCLEVRSDKPLQVSGRIYNQAAAGTFGQYLEAYRTEDGLRAGQTASLLQLRQQDGEYRTNISVTNTGSGSASVKVRLFDSGGTELTQYTLNPGPGALIQDSEPFKRRANRANLGWGFATVEVISGSGVLASASVVDSRTNDATTIPFKR